MTVRQLIERLSEFPADMEVEALWDTVPGFKVHRVELYRGVALIDVGSGDGDWETILSDEQRRGNH